MKKKMYEVRVDVVSHTKVRVEAVSEEDAKDKAVMTVRYGCADLYTEKVEATEVEEIVEN